MGGKVYLVGAGPGDPELLTLKALRVIQEADVILHDDLVSAEVLGLATPGTRILRVGKRCGPKHVSQGTIQELMIGYALGGLAVVRLKGGDPLIFGRAGEELAALLEAGIEFEIVPGITAASAAAAAAEIPLTHRELSSSVVFLTGHPAGHEATGDWPPLDASGSKPPAATVVVYMPGPGDPRLRDRLLALGFEGRTPCLVVSGASTAHSKTHRTTLAELPKAPELEAPRILIVGEVAALARPKTSKPAATSRPERTVVRTARRQPVSASTAVSRG